MAEAFSATCPLLKASNLILRWSTQGLVHVPCWWYWTSLNITFKWFWPRHRPCVISAGETGCAWIQWFQWNAALSNLDQWWSMMINCVYGISMVIRSFHGFWDVLQPHHLWLSCSIPMLDWSVDELGRWSMDRPNFLLNQFEPMKQVWCLNPLLVHQIPGFFLMKSWNPEFFDRIPNMSS